MNTIYIVTAGWDYEGTSVPSVQWVFVSETAAREHFVSVTNKIRGGATEYGEWVAAKGPYASGEAIRPGDAKRLAFARPWAEDRAAEQKVRNEKRKAELTRKAAKASEPTDGYAAMRMRDGG
jgi:hypothetical protein